jgi:protein TonB
VTVLPNGLPTDCRIARSSGHDDLDKSTCNAFLKRGRFHPALDKSGQPMQAPFFEVASWAIKN